MTARLAGRTPHRRGGRFAFAFILVAFPSLGFTQVYDPVFAGYQSYKSERSAIDWRQTNQIAAELGGYVGQMRASSPARGAPTASTGESPKPGAIPSMTEMMSSIRKIDASATARGASK